MECKLIIGRLAKGLAVALVLAVLSTLIFGKRSKEGSSVRLTSEETELILNSDSVMRVLTMDCPEDSVLLRATSDDFSDKDLRSTAYSTLAAKMVRTVTDPSQDGVGIAGPQVGLSRRIVAVMRYDKPDKPFEVYPNIRLDSLWGEITHGPEGCLSVPGKRGIVPRYSKVLVSYKDPETLRTVRDTVDGYTAIIFQHEVDHLQGIVYTDKADSVFARN